MWPGNEQTDQIKQHGQFEGGYTPLDTSAWLSLSTPETVTGLAPRMEKPSSPSTRERVTVRGEDQLCSAENAGSGPCAHKEMLKTLPDYRGAEAHHKSGDRADRVEERRNQVPKE